MEYKYTNKNLSKEEIEIMLSKSTILKRNMRNLGCCTLTLYLIIILICVSIYLKFTWNNIYIFIIGIYFIMMSIVFFRKRFNLKSVIKSEYKKKSMNQSLKFDEDRYIYSNTDFSTRLNKHSVIEIIKFNKYILIFLLPSKLKSILYFPVFIPKDIFESEEKYIDFINRMGNEQ